MLNRLLKFSSIIFFFLYPLLYLSFTADSYEFPKMMLVGIYTLYMFILISINWAKEKKISVMKNTFALPLVALAVLMIASTLIQSPNIVIPFVTPLATSTMILGVFLYIILITIIESEEKEQYMAILLVDGAILSLYTLLLYTGLIPKSVFTPAGSIFATATLMGMLTLYGLTRSIVTWKLLSEIETQEGEEKPSEDDLQIIKNKLIFYIVITGLMALALVLVAYHLLTDQVPIVLPMKFGWAITMEAYKNIKTLLLGIGPSNFLTAFTLAKPVGFNTSPVWNIIFTNSTSYVFTLATEVGIIGFAIFVYIVIKGIKLLRDATVDSPLTSVNPRLSYIIPMLGCLICLSIFPGNMVLFITTIIFLAFSAFTEKPKTLHLKKLKHAVYIVILPSVLLASAIGYVGGRAYLAEYSFKKSLDSLVNNQGTLAYNFQKDAIAYNPFLDRYHVAFSQTNLALANAIAGNRDASKEDKQKIPNLVQQSIDEARTGVALYRTNVINWDNLATVYSSILNYAQGSDTWAIQSYQQKILLDPVGPSSRMGLGGLYLTLKKYEDAEILFRQAINLKPDFANAYFNLAVSLRMQGKTDVAKLALDKARTLLPPGSDDLKKIEGELGHLNDQTAPPPEATPSALASPSAQPVNATPPPKKTRK